MPTEVCPKCQQRVWIGADGVCPTCKGNSDALAHPPAKPSFTYVLVIAGLLLLVAIIATAQQIEQKGWAYGLIYGLGTIGFVVGMFGVMAKQRTLIGLGFSAAVLGAILILLSHWLG